MRRPLTAFLTAGQAVAACLLLTVPALSQPRAEALTIEAATKSAPAPKPGTPASKEKVPSTAEQPERRAECAWIGQRILSLLWRDDVNTATAQTRFYETFGCPAEHLPVAFRCVIEQSENQPEQNDLNARVYACWMAPEARETSQP
jgi:hypothetical protein